MRRYEYLSDEQVEQFLARGFCVIKNAFTREQARPYLENLWQRLGYDPQDQSTWKVPFIQMPSSESNKIDIKQFSPRAYGAICEALGGEDRMWHCAWSDHFRVNFGTEEDARQWLSPAQAATAGPDWKNPSAGWHADGGWYVRFLDSFEVGLQTLTLWSDSRPRGGGTFLACDSVGIVARYLAEHPEGERSGMFGGELLSRFLSQCKDFMEIHGEVGDVYLIHPFMLHAGSRNALRVPRIIMNTHARLKQPMNFNRANPDEFSLIERAILRGLGKERLDFAPTAQRERIERNPDGTRVFRAYTSCAS